MAVMLLLSAAGAGRVTPWLFECLWSPSRSWSIPWSQRTKFKGCCLAFTGHTGYEASPHCDWINPMFGTRHLVGILVSNELKALPNSSPVLPWGSVTLKLVTRTLTGRNTKGKNIMQSNCFKTGMNERMNEYCCKVFAVTSQMSVSYFGWTWLRSTSSLFFFFFRFCFY